MILNRQRKISKNLGKDTHVRSYQGNAFRDQASNMFQVLGGEILFPQPEPLYRQNMVTVELARGGRIPSVAYPGAFSDPVTGNIHGMYEGPIPGQMVMVGFENGNFSSPYVVNRYPYQGKGNTLYESAYINPLTKALFDSTDVIMGHFSGSYLSFNTGILSGELPGSVSLFAMTEINTYAGTNALFEALVSAEVKSAILKLTGSTRIELNGNTNWAIKYTEMKAAFDSLKQTVNTHVHSGVTTGVGSTGVLVTPATADMASAKNTTVLM